MRCDILCTMTTMMSWSSCMTCYVEATNLQERRAKKTSGTRRRQRQRASNRNLQILIWPEQTLVVSTNSTTGFPTDSPISTSTVNNVDPFSIVDPKSCKSGKGRTCTPSTRPSVAPSESPSISHMPTISFQPSAEPSISHRPSAMPSPSPTSTPSTAPSLYPSPQPSDAPSQTPTISPPPTIVPSTAPSEQPSPAPSTGPTISSQPTITAKPSIAPIVDPNGVIDRIVTDDEGHTGVASQCRRDIPSTASSVTEQLVVYEYDITTTPGTELTFVTDAIAVGIQKEMSNQFLSCTFGEDTASNDSFDTHAISSLPVDIATTTTNNCTTTDGTVADCHRINAAFTATIFYTTDEEGRRKLQNDTTASTNTTMTTTTPTTIESMSSDTITDPMVSERFSSSLQSLFESGQITSDISSVTSTEFQGLANDDTNNGTTPTTDDNIPPPGTDDDATTSQSDKSLSGGKIAGSVIGTLIGLALIAAIIAFFIVRRRNYNDDTTTNNNNNSRRVNTKNRTMDVTQEDFNDLDGAGGGGAYTYDGDNDDDENDDRDVRAMIDRSIIASDDGSYFSGYINNTGKVVQRSNTAYIVDDDQETMYTKDFHHPIEPSFSERIRGAEQPGPTFVKTNEVLYQMHEINNDDETGEIGTALQRSVASDGNSHQQRDYSAPDTVNL